VGWSTSPRAYSARWSVQFPDSQLAGWSTSPQVYGAWWSIQSPSSQTDRLVDQSPSLWRLVVGTVPRFSNWQAGRPVPESMALGGRYSPQVLKLAGWSTSPRAYGARWSVQSPDSQTGRLVDQSPSLWRSVVGTVPRFSNWKAGQPVPERMVLGGRYSPQVCHT